MVKNNLDPNNIESGYWLPEELRYYTDNVHYVHKYGMIAQAIKASKVICGSKIS